MKLMLKMVQIVVALLITIVLIVGFKQLRTYNNNLNKVTNYSIVSKDEVTIDQFNQFLSDHGSTTELNYEQAREMLENDLEYYSFWEKLRTRDHQITTQTNDNDQILTEIQEYYDNLSNVEQEEFDAYLNNRVEETIEMGGEQDEQTTKEEN